jgi:hypothetical protein
MEYERFFPRFVLMLAVLTMGCKRRACEPDTLPPEWRDHPLVKSLPSDAVVCKNNDRTPITGHFCADVPSGSNATEMLIVFTKRAEERGFPRSVEASSKTGAEHAMQGYESSTFPQRDRRIVNVTFIVDGRMGRICFSPIS